MIFETERVARIVVVCNVTKTSEVFGKACVEIRVENCVETFVEICVEVCMVI